MSKNHVADNQDDIDAALDDFIKHKKTAPVVSTIDNGIDLFGADEKKKSFLQRVLSRVTTFRLT